MEARTDGQHLFVFRPENIEPILASDPGFYRSNGELVWEAIVRVSPENNGELLGYGARSMAAGDVQVIIHAADDPRRIFAGFHGDSRNVETFALDRLREIADYTGEPLTYTILPIER